MDAIKKRRVLTETELFSIVESTEAELAAASQKLINVATDALDGTFDASTLERLVKTKAYQASTVLVDGQPAFVLVHGQNPLGWLIVEGAAKIGQAPIEHLFEGGYALARYLKAPQVIFVTKLRALFRYAMDHDFKSLGVILCKEVPDAPA